MRAADWSPEEFETLLQHALADLLTRAGVPLSNGRPDPRITKGQGHALLLLLRYLGI